MAVHLQTEIEKLKKRITLYGGMIEKNLGDAIRSIQARDADLARQVLGVDDQADQWEVDTEEECLKILALHQPVAVDLRFIIAVLKINNDLERISNQAVLIASHVLAIIRSPGGVAPVAELGEIFDRIEDMVRESVEALITRNGELAWRIWEQHMAACEDMRRIIDELTDRAQNNPRQTSGTIRLIRAVVAIGQVIEYAKDIAEEVIYMREGIIVKHHEREFLSRKKAAAKPGSGQAASR